MMSRLKSRSVFLLVCMPWSCSVMRRERRAARGGSERGEDVDDEVQRVGALDARLLVAFLAVAELRRHGEDDPAADRDALEALVPALDDPARAELEVEGLAALV